MCVPGQGNWQGLRQGLRPADLCTATALALSPHWISLPESQAPEEAAVWLGCTKDHPSGAQLLVTTLTFLFKLML